jgi:hypothetical protein
MQPKPGAIAQAAQGLAPEQQAKLSQIMAQVLPLANLQCFYTPSHPLSSLHRSMQSKDALVLCPGV